VKTKNVEKEEIKSMVVEVMETYYQRDRSTTDALIKDIHKRFDGFEREYSKIQNLLQRMIKLLDKLT